MALIGERVIPQSPVSPNAGGMNIISTTAPPATEQSQIEPIDPYQLLPVFVRRCLLIGAEPDWVRARCTEGIEEFWCDNDPEAACARFSKGYFDAVLVTAEPDSSRQLLGWLTSLTGVLDVNGILSIVFPDSISRVAFISRFEAIGRYTGLNVYDDDPVASALRLVFASYNPVTHARLMAASGRPAVSIQILAGIPPDLIVNEEMLAAIAAEKQQYYLALQKSCSGDPPHSWFSKSQREFAQATAIDPGFYLPYQTQADYWRHMGDDRTADVVCRNFQQSQVPGPHFCKIETDAEAPYPNTSLYDVETARNLPDPRILILGHSASDYGTDTLYDGLCRVIGSQNVVEYPPKPMLHGHRFDAAQNYPCTFTHPPGPSRFRDILARLESGWFDIILFADVVEMKCCGEVRLLLKASANLPIVVYDSWDDCYTPINAILEYIDRPKVDLVFKREMLAGIDYGEYTVPLPFGYPASMVDEIPDYTARRYDFFWAGKREFGLRPIMLQEVERQLNRKFNQTFDQAAYKERIRHSRIGLSLWGFGFDTVRFWEIPAHGGLLLAQRPPIRIPNNFVDGHTAVMFDDLNELAGKLTYYLNNPGAAEKIAKAGHRHWKNHHTTEARAGQLLSHIEHRCGW